MRGWSEPRLAGALLRVVDSLGTALLLLDEDGMVLFANPRAAELLEHSTRSLEHRDVASLIAPLEELAASEGSRGEHGRSARKVRLTSGRLIDIGYTLSSVTISAGSVHYALTFQDITDILRLSEERDRLLKLATVGEALPSLLHELKNPLAAIASSVELLIEESSDTKQQAELHAVLTEVRRTALSLDGIGSVGCTVASRSLSAVDLAVREACTVLKSRAQRAGVELACEAQTMPLLWLDASVIRAAVFNLVTNAIHACSAPERDDARVLVVARLVDTGTVFELSVRDNGTGMTEEVHERCTDLFFSTKRSGSGIGLALCKQIVDGVGGELRIDTEIGKGTQVAMRLPVPKPPRNTPIAPR